MSRKLLMTLCFLSSCLTTVIQATEPEYLKAIGAAEKRASIETVKTEAHVTVSDGLEYDVVTLFHDRQRAIFHRTYPDRRITLGIDGKYTWSFDGEVEEEAPEAFGGFILGHQFHAEVLFFDELYGPLGAPVEVDCGGGRCLSYAGSHGHSLLVNRDGRHPVGLVVAREGEPDIEFTFDDWREVDGIDLPFVVGIDDGERTFRYEFSSVSLNEGSMDELRAPMSKLTDEQQILRLHRIAMDAHLLGDANLMKGLFAPESTVVSEGEIYHSTGPRSEAMMERILSNRDYTRYDDVVRPVVKVSADGSLGWVIVQVAAEGVRFDDTGAPTGPLEFTCAWISMFEKIDGEWKQIGNVSNFKPGRT